LKKISVSIIIIYALNFISCSSDNIKMLPEMKAGKIHCVLYLPDFPAPSNIGAPEGIFYLTYTKYTRPEINAIYNSTDINELRYKFIKSLMSKLKKIPQNIIISSPDSINTALEIQKQDYTEEDYKKNPRLSVYDFTGVRNRLNVKYIFEISLFQWGHLYTDTHYTFFNGAAAIYDITNNTTAWRYYFNNQTAVGGLTLSGTGISTLDRDSVINSLDCNINNITDKIKGNLSEEFRE